ncbi:MAG: biopolymer transporter ExbD [Planctomycetaceae bacterium]|nr:biopolymer transporter ExbD [Planctomycetaceae bacterium]
MPLRTDSLEEPSLNLTPMIDIVFLLIIFFMVGTRFSEIEQKFDIQLPTAAPMKSLSREPDPLVINVARAGDISINGQQLNLNEVRQQLKDAKAAWADQPVLIRGDGEGTYQAIVDVMNLCHEAEIKRFSLAFQPAGEESAP